MSHQEHQEDQKTTTGDTGSTGKAITVITNNYPRVLRVPRGLLNFFLRVLLVFFVAKRYLSLSRIS